MADKLPARPRKSTDKQVEEALRIIPRFRRDWLAAPGVTAVDIGYRTKNGKRTGDVALRAHVERKLPREALPAHEFISESESPRTYDGVVVDVVQGSYGPAVIEEPPRRTRGVAIGDGGNGLAWAREAALLGYETLETIDRRSRVDPLVAGISCGNARVTAGTLGAIVWDRKNCKPSILSNWHVLCGDPACVAGEPIRQPGPFDGGTSADEVAALTRWQLNEHADAALANLTGGRSHSRDVVGLAPIAGLEEPALGMKVHKSGRTTAVTEGEIDGVHMTLSINYGSTVQTFHDQVRIVPLPPWPAVDYEVSKGGDSGSVWINQANGKAVGLHFAGETESAPSAEHAIANRMPKVAELLELSFTPLFCFSPTLSRRPPIIDGKFVARLRLVLCSRFPWLCGGPRWLPPQEVESRAAATTCAACGDGSARAAGAAGATGFGGEAIDALVEEILGDLNAPR